jgi:hypothetical protein
MGQENGEQKWPATEERGTEMEEIRTKLNENGRNENQNNENRKGPEGKESHERQHNRQESRDVEEEQDGTKRPFLEVGREWKKTNATLEERTV